MSVRDRDLPREYAADRARMVAEQAERVARLEREIRAKLRKPELARPAPGVKVFGRGKRRQVVCTSQFNAFVGGYPLYRTISEAEQITGIAHQLICRSLDRPHRAGRLMWRSADRFNGEVVEHEGRKFLKPLGGGNVGEARQMSFAEVFLGWPSSDELPKAGRRANRLTQHRTHKHRYDVGGQIMLFEEPVMWLN